MKSKNAGIEQTRRERALKRASLLEIELQSPETGLALPHIFLWPRGLVWYIGGRLCHGLHVQGSGVRIR